MTFRFVSPLILTCLVVLSCQKEVEKPRLDAISAEEIDAESLMEENQCGCTLPQLLLQARSRRCASRTGSARSIPRDLRKPNASRGDAGRGKSSAKWLDHCQ